MKFRKKPMVIDAIQFRGWNDKECLAFCPFSRDPIDTKPNLIIATSYGEALVSVGDWITRTAAGEFDVCKRDIFAASYEAVE